MRATPELAEGGPLSSRSEVFLLQGLRNGDEACFEELFYRYRNKVYGVVFRLVGNREEAEDLTQEVFLQLYHHPLPGGRENNIAGWLYRVAINAGYNAIRSRKRDDRRLNQAGGAMVMPKLCGSEPVEELLAAEERSKVRQVLLGLGERSRGILVLRYAGLSYAEMANALRVAPSSVGTLLARAEREFRGKYLAVHSEERG